MTTLKVEVAYLRKDFDYLKSTNFTCLFEAVETEGVLACSKIPLATTKDVPVEDVVADASQVETDTEQLDKRYVAIYNDLAYLQDVMFENGR